MPSSAYKDILKAQREVEATSRAGLKWEKDEDEKLIKMVQDKVDLADIAKSFKRTEGSIRTRLILSSVRKMEIDNLSLQEAANLFFIPEKDITEYLEKKALREERIAKIKNTKKTGQNVTNSDIYELLQKLEKKFEALTSK
jgi:hypothetical protein